MPLSTGQKTEMDRAAGARFASIREEFLNRWRAAEDSTRFAAMRIAFGLVLLADITHLYAHLTIFPTVATWPLLRPVLLLWLFVIVSVIVGYRLRAAAIANYLFCGFVLGVLAPTGGFSGADPVAIGLSLLIVLLPCNAATLDRIGGRRELQPAISAARWLLAAYLSSIYVDSAIHKILSPMWISGFGVATPMGLANMVWMDTGWLARIPALVLRLVGWSVVGFELLFPLLYVWRVTRFFAVAAGIALHAGIACIYPIPAFSGEMIAIYLGLLPDQCYVPLQRLDRLLAGRASRAPIAARALWPRLTFRGMLVIVALWAGAIALVYAPQFVTNRPVWFMLKGARRVSYVATGINSRAVFLDGDFAHYQHQLRIVEIDRNGSERIFPYSRNGLFAWEVRDRVWNQWWKNTQGYPVPLGQAEALLGIWGERYWGPVAAPLVLRIDARNQAVAMDRIDTALFSRNAAVAWRNIGEIRLRPGAAPQVFWSSPPKSQKERLGDYLRDVLPARTQ
jgi:hypothetical protein